MTDLRSYEGIGGGQLDPSGTTLAPTPAAAPKYKYLALNITQTAAHFDGYFPKIVDIFMLDGTGGEIPATALTWSGPVNPDDSGGSNTADHLNDDRNNNWWSGPVLQAGGVTLSGVLATASALTGIGIYPLQGNNAPSTWRLYGSMNPIPADFSGATLLTSRDEPGNEWADTTRRNFIFG